MIFHISVSDSKGMIVLKICTITLCRYVRQKYRIGNTTKNVVSKAYDNTSSFLKFIMWFSKQNSENNDHNISLLIPFRTVIGN